MNVIVSEKLRKFWGFFDDCIGDIEDELAEGIGVQEEYIAVTEDKGETVTVYLLGTKVHHHHVPKLDRGRLVFAGEIHYRYSDTGTPKELDIYCCPLCLERSLLGRVHRLKPSSEKEFFKQMQNCLEGKDLAAGKRADYLKDPSA